MRRSESRLRRRRVAAFAVATALLIAVVLLGAKWFGARHDGPAGSPPAATTLAVPLADNAQAAESVAPPGAADPQAGAHWARLSPMQRQALRARYAAWKALPAEEKQQLQAAAAEFAALPAERQQDLRAQFDGLDRIYRDGWRLGPAIGRDYVALHPLIGFVPESQRDALLALLRSLDAEQRGQLARIAQRTPPQDRQSLRNTLLALPPDQRAAWLQHNAAH